MLILNPIDHEEIYRLIRSHLPDVQILAYGSRVTGRCYDASDLDLALRSEDGEPIPRAAIAELRDALSDSNIPIIVEVRDWATLPPTFQHEIERHYVYLEPPAPAQV